MISTDNVNSLTDFQRNARSFLKRLKRTGKPALLTVNGRGAAVIMDPSVYEKLVAQAWKDAEAAAIQMAVLEAEAGLGRPLVDVARELRARSRRLANRPKRRSA